MSCRLAQGAPQREAPFVTQDRRLPKRAHWDGGRYVGANGVDLVAGELKVAQGRTSPSASAVQNPPMKGAASTRKKGAAIMQPSTMAKQSLANPKNLFQNMVLSSKGAA